MKSQVRNFLLAILGALLFTACHTPAHPTVMVTPSGEVVVPDQPPRPQRELVGSPPGASYAWVDGYWTHPAESWVWVPGSRNLGSHSSWLGLDFEPLGISLSCRQPTPTSFSFLQSCTNCGSLQFSQVAFEWSQKSRTI